jgi:hypothetical protein
MILLLNWNSRCSCFSDSGTATSKESASISCSKNTFLLKCLHYAYINSDQISRGKSITGRYNSSGSKKK